MNSFRCVSAAALLLAAGDLAHAGFVVAPNSYTNTEANSAISGSSGGTRWQQVFHQSQFAGSGPITITSIAFRLDSTFGVLSFADTLSSIRFDLSTTAAAPNAMSTTYANNVGADVTTVFNGSWSRSGVNNGGPGTNAFDIVLNLTTSFLYDPSLGNLLLDVRNSGSGQLFVGQDYLGGSNPWTSSISGFNAPTGFVGAGGVITQFGFTSNSEPAPVPLPATALPGLFAVLSLFVVHRMGFAKVL